MKNLNDKMNNGMVNFGIAALVGIDSFLDRIFLGKKCGLFGENLDKGELKGIVDKFFGVADTYEELDEVTLNEVAWDEVTPFDSPIVSYKRGYRYALEHKEVDSRIAKVYEILGIKADANKEICDSDLEELAEEGVDADTSNVDAFKIGYHYCVCGIDNEE